MADKMKTVVFSGHVCCSCLPLNSFHALSFLLLLGAQRAFLFFPPPCPIQISTPPKPPAPGSVPTNSHPSPLPENRTPSELPFSTRLFSSESQTTRQLRTGCSTTHSKKRTRRVSPIFFLGMPAWSMLKTRPALSLNSFSIHHLPAMSFSSAGMLPIGYSSFPGSCSLFGVAECRTGKQLHTLASSLFFSRPTGSILVVICDRLSCCLLLLFDIAVLLPFSILILSRLSF